LRINKKKILGIIKKQSIQGSIFLYLGVFIGFITSLVLFPHILSEKEIGLLSTLVAYSTIFAQTGTLGFNSVILKMFSYFRNHKNNHNGFFFIIFVVIILGFGFSTALFFILKPYIVKENIINSPLFVEYIYFLLPLTFFTLAFYIFDTYYSVLFFAVRGIFLKEFVQRVLILLVLIIYYLQCININSFVIAYVVSLSAPTVLIIIWLIYDGEFVLKNRLSFVKKDLRNAMLSVSLFGILSGMVGSINIQVDKIMASSMLSLQVTGIYTTIIVLTGFIRIPSRAVLKIAAAVIAEAWKNNDTEEVKKVYLATSINQYIIALLVFVGLWANVHNIFMILPPNYEIGKYVILFTGIAFTFEMATGASNNVIANSKHYKYLTYFVAFMLVLAILLNYLLIPIFKINGLALATAITLITYNITKVIFIYLKFKMQPFSMKYLHISLIGLFVYLVSLLIPVFEDFIVDILIRSGFITITFTLLLFLSKTSAEFNSAVTNFFWGGNKFK